MIILINERFNMKMPSQSQQKKHQNKGQWSGSVEFIVNFEYMERLVLVFLLLTLNR